MVEDDRTIALGLSYSLNEEGYGVTVCNDVSSTLEEIKDRRFELAILDVLLPDGNGLDICQAMKTKTDTPIIFLTALGEESDVVTGLEIGADDYVTKPFRLRELLSRVRMVLRRAGGEENEVISIEGLTIYLKQAKVTKDGKEIPLTALEYRILRTLAINRGQILNRSCLLEDIWDIDGDFVNDNTLTVYIKRLRKKIEDDPKNPVIIRTVRGLGYRMGE